MELTDKMQAEIVQAVSNEVLEVIVRRMENIFDDDAMKVKIALNILTNVCGNFILHSIPNDDEKLENFKHAWSEFIKRYEFWYDNAIKHVESGRTFTMKISRDGVTKDVE